MSSADKTNSAAGRFGTFGGVFTPCVLTILGVIMFLRYGYVVGQAGVIGALIILAVPKICLLYTSPSPRDRQKSRMPSSA